MCHMLTYPIQTIENAKQLEKVRSKDHYMDPLLPLTPLRKLFVPFYLL